MTLPKKILLGCGITTLAVGILVVVGIIAVVVAVERQIETAGESTKGLIAAFDAGDMMAAQRAVDAGANVNIAVVGRPLLFVFVRDNEIENVEFLLRNGANVNTLTSHGRTPLHEAALYGHVETAVLLIRYGANVNATNPRGETPLFYAEDGLIAGPSHTPRHTEVAKLIRQHGGTK